MDFNISSRIIITCNKRLSTYLEKEVTDLGFTVKNTFVTGVELTGSINDCITLNLNLRCASQVLYSLDSFRCDGPEELYRNLLRIEWEKIISPEGYFSV